ncbi:hypothetical protein Tco_1286326 [Tanacetum coccineum]
MTPHQKSKGVFQENDKEVMDEISVWFRCLVMIRRSTGLPKGSRSSRCPTCLPISLNKETRIRGYTGLFSPYYTLTLKSDNGILVLWFHSPSLSCKTHANMEDKKKDKGKAITHLPDNPTSHSGVNEKSLLDATSGPPDVLPDLGPFGNVFDFPDGGAIDGNTMVNEFLSKPSWTSAYENNKVQVKAEQGFEAMTGVKPSYVSDACGKH